MGVFLEIKQKFTNKWVEVGERFSYCINVKNISNSIIKDLVYKEKINSKLKIISINIDGKEIEYNITNNNIVLPIGRINIDETKSIFITLDILDYVAKNQFNSMGKFQGKIMFENIIEEVNEDIPHVYLYIINPKIVTTILSSSNEVVTDEIIDIVIIVENLGNIDVENVVVRDILKDGLRFIEKTVEIEKERNTELNPNNGICIGDLKIQQLKVIKFKARIDYKNNENIITNKAIVRYDYINDIGELNKRGVSISNVEKLLLQAEEATMVIESDKDDVCRNSEISYKVTISNTGTLDLYNLCFKKEYLKSVVLSDNNINIDGKVQKIDSIEDGIFLGDLKINNSIQLEFKLKYNNGIERNFLENIFILEKDYKLKDKFILKGRTIKESIKHSINISSFNYTVLEGIISLSEQNPNIREINNLNCKIDINEYYYINTFTGIANDNQINTGKKLIVNGVIKSNVEYIADTQEGAVHFVDDKQIFSTFVNLPDSMESKYNLIVTGKVEESSYILEQENKIKTIVSIVVIVKVLMD